MVSSLQDVHRKASGGAGSLSKVSSRHPPKSPAQLHQVQRGLIKLIFAITYNYVGVTAHMFQHYTFDPNL